MKSFHLFKRAFCPILIAIFLTFNITACTQQNELYNELVGDYEYYYEDQFIPAYVFVQEDTLFCDVGVGITLVLKPVNIDRLTFNSENEGSYFDIRFEREKNGKISRFLFTAGDVTIPVEKQGREIAKRFYSAEEIEEDFNQLRSFIEKTHPALYAFTNKQDFDAFFQQQFSRIEENMPIESVYPIFASLTAKIGCGHCMARMPEGYWEETQGGMFPIQLKFIEDKVYALGTYSETDFLPKGSKILSINGKHIDVIVDEMRKLISTDAYSHTYQNFRLGKRFSFLYAILYGHPDSFLVGFSEIGESKPNETIVDPVPIRNLPKEMEDHHGLGIEIVQEKIVAILTVSHFAFYDNREFFYNYIDEAFSKMEQGKIEKLILDVRGNTGGDPFCAAHLLSYLEEAPVIYFSKPYGEYFKLTQPIPLHPDHFKGEFITLIDGGGFSTTGHFVSLLKFHKFGKLVGEETGATYTCNDASRSYHLKNTRILGHIASRTFATAVSDLPGDRGIIPDHQVTQTPEDIAKGIDTVLEFALALLQ